ncbi:hypothetical protein EYF80_055348 [Liparis tanakae]|uniref:Uncharacterized protein n=1 Tax=Liparis tanakae TaxID=230148 RepID=A0A4Z2F1Y7_9TELE|nr:hypothetical protein EYF80_055348 [Liparis tanakae]
MQLLLSPSVSCELIHNLPRSDLQLSVGEAVGPWSTQNGCTVQSCSSLVSDIITATTLNLTLPLVTITALPPYSARNEKTD